MRARAWMLAAVAGLLLVAGAGVAYATGSGEDASGQAAGANVQKAESVALEHVSGRVTDTEVGDEEGYYEIEVTKEGGGQVDVHLDKDFNVLSTPADHEGPEDEGASDDDEDSGE